MVKLNKNGTPKDVKKMGQLCALFTVCVVCCIVLFDLLFYAC